MERRKWLGGTGTIVIIFSLVKPIITTFNWAVNMISEGRTVHDLWPIILPWIVWTYGEIPLWGNAILMCVGIGLLYAARQSPASAMPVSVSTQARDWILPSTDRVLEAVRRLQRRRPEAGSPKVKIVTTKNGRVVAALLVSVFQTAGWHLQDNPEDGSYIFSMKSDQIVGLKLRYRQTFDEIGSTVEGALSAIYFLEIQKEQFPDLDVAHYGCIQIEIGDRSVTLA